MTYQIHLNSLGEMQRKATLRINESSWLGANKIIVKNYQNYPNFCQSLYFDWQKESLGWKNSDLKDNDEWEAVMYINFTLIQAMEDVFVALGVDKTELSAWIATFIQWCHSPMFRHSWQPFKRIYNIKTQEFIDLIIARTPDSNEIKNKEALFEIALNITNSAEMKAILSK